MEPIQEGCGDDGVPKNFAPFGKSAVGGEDHRALFIAGVDELKEQIASACSDWQIPVGSSPASNIAGRVEKRYHLADRCLCAARRKYSVTLRSSPSSYPKSGGGRPSARAIARVCSSSMCWHSKSNVASRMLVPSRFHVLAKCGSAGHLLEIVSCLVAFKGSRVCIGKATLLELVAARPTPAPTLAANDASPQLGAQYGRRGGDVV